MRPISLQTYPKQAALWRGCLRYAFRAVLHATLHANPRGTLEATMGRCFYGCNDVARDLTDLFHLWQSKILQFFQLGLVDAHDVVPAIHGRQVVVHITTFAKVGVKGAVLIKACLLYTSPSPRDLSTSRMPSSA